MRAMISVTMRFGGGIAGRSRVEMSSLELPEGTTVQDVLDLVLETVQEPVDWTTVLIAINGRWVPEKQRDSRTLEEGDVLSVIRALPGG